MDLMDGTVKWKGNTWMMFTSSFDILNAPVIINGSDHYAELILGKAHITPHNSWLQHQQLINFYHRHSLFSTSFIICQRNQQIIWIVIYSYSILNYSWPSIFLTPLLNPRSALTSSRDSCNLPTPTLWMLSVLVRSHWSLEKGFRLINEIFLYLGCLNISTVFSHAQTVVLCSSCGTVLCQPTGGRARLTEGKSFVFTSFTTKGRELICNFLFRLFFP